MGEFESIVAKLAPRSPSPGGKKSGRSDMGIVEMLKQPVAKESSGERKQMMHSMGLRTDLSMIALRVSEKPDSVPAARQ